MTKYFFRIIIIIMSSSIIIGIISCSKLTTKVSNQTDRQPELCCLLRPHCDRLFLVSCFWLAAIVPGENSKRKIHTKIYSRAFLAS